MKSKRLTFWVTVIVMMLVGVVITGCSKHDTNDAQDYENPVITTTENIENPVITNTTKENIKIPVIIATENIDGASATALSFGYSWTDGKKGAVADGIPVWQGEYKDKNTLIIDGEMGQNTITLSAEASAIEFAVEGLASASYAIYLPDGTVYDDGTRSPLSSLSPRMWWTGNDSSMGIIAPFDPGEYVYELTLIWEKDELQVTYGIKLIMTGQRNAYDEALDVVWKHYNDAISVSLEGTETLRGSEYAGECYVFAAETPDGIVRVAVSKEQYILFEYIDDLWVEYAEYYAQAHEWIDYYKGDMPYESVGTVYSDDGKYKIEGYGIDYSVVVSGENPVKEIRIVEISSGKTVWNTVGLYLLYEHPNFCWSPDSRYVSGMYAARTWVDAMIVDTKDMTEYSLPGLFELFQLFPEFSPRSDRADPYIIPEYWLNDHTIIVAFSWVPASGLSPEKDRLEGKYQYDANTQELTVINIDS